MLTWDEPERRPNLRKHRIDLAELEPIFDLPMITHLISCRHADRQETNEYFKAL